MNLLINEWRKFIHRPGISVTFPVIQLFTTVLYYFAVSQIGKVKDTKLFFASSSQIATFFVLTLGMIYAATILTTEFSSGTIKFILTRPYDRHKVLLAKIGSVTIITTGLTIVSEIINYLLEFISLGRAPEINTVLKVSGTTILTIFLGIIFYGTFSIMVTALINSSALSTALTFIYYTSAAPLWYAVCIGFFKISTDSWIYKLAPFIVNSELISMIQESGISFDSDFLIILAANIVYVCLFYIIADLFFSKKDISLSK